MLTTKRLAAGLALAAALPSLSACGTADAIVARKARVDLVGATKLDLETCLGLPDQHSSEGKTEILTYNANSPHGESLGIGSIGVSYSGYCHATFRLDNGRVTKVRYSGQTDVFGARDGVCAPIVRACLEDPEPSIGTRMIVPSAPVAVAR